MQRLKVHAIDPMNYADGPGARYTIWLQGCSILCEGCFNPATHDPQAGYWLSIDELLSDIQQHTPTVEGISISGGEPLDQAPALAIFLQQYKQSKLGSALLFSGYSYQAITQNAQYAAVLPYLDVLISGPYQKENAIPGGFPASSNQEIILLSQVYTLVDLHTQVATQINITNNGEIHISGIDPLVM